uniref:Heat shock 70 kDa protein 12A n=1 Tax=Cuerna arida TaxID=1464854 RepID=A0A1B6GZM7_9HEMI
MEVQHMPSSTREVFHDNGPPNMVTTSYEHQNSQTFKARDSSVDSGIHPASNISPICSLSDTDSEILQAFSSQTLPSEDTQRLSSHETDNLVEEVYLAQDSLQHLNESKQLSNIKGNENSDENGTFHASPYLIPEDNSSRNSVESNHTQNINVKHFPKEEDILARHLKPSYNKNIAGVGDDKSRYYVNQCELKSRIKQIPISEGVIAASTLQGSDIQVEVVVAIDLGTTYSGYAYCYTRHHFDKEVHMMRNWEGGDPGLNNQKIPTTLLISPEGLFHSFGFAARDFYHDLEPQDACRWFYFDKFKKTLHNNPNIRQDTKISAANGQRFPAVDIFSMALRYLSRQVLTELSDQGGGATQENVRWVVTVPAIWSHGAKQLIREAVYKAEMCSRDNPEALIIALEPEAAAVWCKNLRFDQLDGRHMSKDQYQQSSQGNCYVIVDCGGGTVDVTVHKLHHPKGPLKELYKASGEPCGSLGVDEEFDRLLGSVFGFSFMTRLRQERPAAYTELMLSFESRKRSVLPSRSTSLNVSLPFAFIDFYQSATGRQVKDAVREYNNAQLTWSSQGMLRISPHLMSELFLPTIDNITKHVEGVLTAPEVIESSKYLFLVGGFAESGLLQEAIRKKLRELKVPPPIIPQGVALCVLKGAVTYGLNPEVVIMRKSQHTYGIGVLKPFQRGIHPLEKLVLRDSREWCADVFDTLVSVNQSLYAGESVLRRYTPANPSQNVIILHIYCTDATQPQFVTDEGVQRVGTLRLELTSELGRDKPREILTRLIFSSTELTVSAMDLETASYTDTSLTFLS